MGLCTLKCVIIRDGSTASKAIQNLMELECKSCIYKFTVFVLGGLQQMINALETSDANSAQILDDLLANHQKNANVDEFSQTTELSTQVISALTHDCGKAVSMMEMAYQRGAYEQCILTTCEICSDFMHVMVREDVKNEIELHAQLASIEEKIHEWISDEEGWFRH